MARPWRQKHCLLPCLNKRKACPQQTNGDRRCLRDPIVRRWTNCNCYLGLLQPHLHIYKSPSSGAGSTGLTTLYIWGIKWYHHRSSFDPRNKRSHVLHTPWQGPRAWRFLVELLLDKLGYSGIYNNKGNTRLFLRWQSPVFNQLNPHKTHS